MAETQNTILTIPVVVHVVYHTPAENIPDSQIISQLEFSQLDFRRLNADTVNTPPAFLPLASDAEIEFCLATRDPWGNPTGGVTRTYTDSISFRAGPVSGDLMKYDSTGGKSAWNPYSYLNVWIVNLTGASGFASNPSGHGAANDGIVMTYTNINNTHLLSHEIGHYLNLIHIYGTENPACQPADGGDLVGDTPDQAWSTFGCPPFPQTDSCSATSPGIMFMNFMDQTSSACQNLFTQGQVTRMRDALVTLRASLLVSGGCAPSFISGPKTVKDICISPNPCSGKFLISASVSFNAVQVCNGLGETIYHRSGSMIPDELDLSGSPKGIYFVKIISAGGIYSAKLAVQ